MTRRLSVEPQDRRVAVPPADRRYAAVEPQDRRVAVLPLDDLGPGFAFDFVTDEMGVLLTDPNGNLIWRG